MSGSKRSTSAASVPKVGGKATGARKAPNGNLTKGGNKRGGIVGHGFHKFKKTTDPQASRAFGNTWGTGSAGASIGVRNTGGGGFSAH